MWRPENSSDTSGTPGYMAPEVMCSRKLIFYRLGQNHGVAADYYALGIIVYECMVLKLEFINNRSEKDPTWENPVRK